MTEYLLQMWDLAKTGDKQGVVFFAALYAFVLLTYSLIYQIRIANWPSTTGRLIAADVDKFGVTHTLRSEQDYVSNALFEYTVDGATHQGTRVSPWVIVASHNAKFLLESQLNKINKNADGSIELFYSPSKPSKSFLIKPSVNGMVVTFVLAVAPISFYWQNYHG